MAHESCTGLCVHAQLCNVHPAAHWLCQTATSCYEIINRNTVTERWRQEMHLVLSQLGLPAHGSALPAEMRNAGSAEQATHATRTRWARDAAPTYRNRQEAYLKSSYTQTCQKCSCPCLHLYRTSKQQCPARPSNACPLIFGYPAPQRSQNVHYKAPGVFLHCPYQHQEQNNLQPSSASPHSSGARCSTPPSAPEPGTQTQGLTSSAYFLHSAASFSSGVLRVFSVCISKVISLPVMRHRMKKKKKKVNITHTEF